MAKEIMDPTVIFEDNRGAKKWAEDPSHHSKTKHIETAVLSIRDELIRFKNLTTQYVPTAQQIADVLTKNLTPKQHWTLSRHMLGAQIPISWYHEDKPT